MSGDLKEGFVKEEKNDVNRVKLSLSGKPSY